MIRVRSMIPRPLDPDAGEDEVLSCIEAKEAARVAGSRAGDDAGESRVVWWRQDSLDLRSGHPAPFFILY
jgi:hypothetical protein